MFEDDDDPSERRDERPRDPKARAQEQADAFRTHAERAAVFEGVRKFDAELKPGLDADVARELQRGVAKLEKAKAGETPVLAPAVMSDAAALLTLCDAKELSTNDYHLYRRPGELMMVRWLKGEEVETWYKRAQAHFDAAIEGFREDEHQAQDWKKDPETTAYLSALDAVEVKMAERYLRDPIRKLGVFVLSTQTADEMDVLHLTDTLMGVTPEDLVGAASAPPDEPTEQDRAWFYKLFNLRGTVDGVERMCFFTYLQKTDDSYDF